MMANVLRYLEDSAKKYPRNLAVIDEIQQYTYQELLQISRRIGSALAEKGIQGAPVMVYMEKSAGALCAFFGVLYAGGCYCFLDPELPKYRLMQMKSVLNSNLVITSRDRRGTAAEQFPAAEIITIEQLAAAQERVSVLQIIRDSSIDTDPVYINFTSGSTDTPKGIVVSHRSILDFIDCFTELFQITERDRIANQAPFDFDVSVKDIYASLKTGATLVIVPRRLFSAPVELLDFLCEHQVTTLIWAVSALCLVSTFHGLDYKTPTTVNKVLFSGEVMPLKHLRSWRTHLPNAMFVNLYGPTEITCNCTYHILESGRDYSDGIPIGKPFPNEDVFLLNGENQKIMEAGRIGELCVRGSALALGYYRAPEQTSARFVQNPLNPRYPELIYRTGDLARYDNHGDLLFSGRKDFQIKYRGHRIELEEIERAIAAIDGVERCCCLFDEKKSRLKGFYVGKIDQNTLHERLKATLPLFMIPSFLREVETMPLTKNGKIDRKQLEQMVGGKGS